MDLKSGNTLFNVHLKRERKGGGSNMMLTSTEIEGNRKLQVQYIQNTVVMISMLAIGW